MEPMYQEKGNEKNNRWKKISRRKNGSEMVSTHIVLWHWGNALTPYSFNDFIAKKNNKLSLKKWVTSCLQFPVKFQHIGTSPLIAAYFLFPPSSPPLRYESYAFIWVLGLGEVTEQLPVFLWIPLSKTSSELVIPTQFKLWSTHDSVPWDALCNIHMNSAYRAMK